MDSEHREELNRKRGEFMEKDKWDKGKMKKEMEDAKTELVDLNRKLVNLMVDFGLRALKTFQAGKKEDLNPLQINEIVSKEIEAVIKTLSGPEYADIIIRKAEHDFYHGASKPL